MLVSDAATVEAVERATQILLGDVRFEHLSSPETTLWDFVAYAALRRSVDHCRNFFERHAQQPETLDCQIRVLHLDVTTTVTIGPVRLVPANDPRVHAIYEPPPDPYCIAIVETVGTNRHRMAGRAAEHLNHTLNQLRLSLSLRQGMPDTQLRFRLGTTFVLSDRSHGILPKTSFSHLLTLDPATATHIVEDPVWTVPSQPVIEVDKRAKLALTWLERATFADELTIGLLYAFFALETLLGDTSEGLKADALAYRQMLLAQVARGSFQHPNQAWNLYALVRSAAVHGESPPEVTAKTLTRFIRSVRESLHDYLQVTRSAKLNRRSKLLKYLDGHADRSAVVDWISNYGGTEWAPYLTQLRSP